MMSAYATSLMESSKEEIVKEALRQHDRAELFRTAILYAIDDLLKADIKVVREDLWNSIVTDAKREI